MASYDKKGNQNGKYIYSISGLSKSGSTTTANINSQVFDKKGKLMGEGNGSIGCKNGELMMDMKMMFSPQQMEQFKDADVSGKGAYLAYPSSIKVGQSLSDASFDMDMKMKTGMEATVSMIITNRTVDAKESVTTPAGTWEAFKVSYDSKTIIDMGIAIPVKIKITEWFVPDFGVVKTESKWGTTELVSIN